MSTSLSASAVPPRRVLFVGDDATSPQIAASLLRDAAGDRVTVDTAATQPIEPGGRSDEMLVAMGLNPAEEKRLSTGALYTADRVVVLGTDIDVARLPGPRYEEWDLAHEDLLARVQALSEDLTSVLTPRPRGSAVVDRLRALLRHRQLRRRPSSAAAVLTDSD
ncbi:hypothetical protein [uncultured Friedmanniella sp.]|uniref:hypothetical protein n=1 Tax=uncultured Friedmanniella sp. TaxID=335381 RepID=UPI0035CA28BC